MTRDEAKERLQLCRPGNEGDRHAPELAEAVAMLEYDAELRQWFEDQQAFDARIAEALAEIVPPADLKERILRESRPPTARPMKDAAPSTGHNAPGSAHPSAQSSSHPSRWRKAWPILAVAAAVALALFAARPWQQPNRENPSSAPAPAVAGVPPIVGFLAEQIEALPQTGLEKKDHRLGELNAFLTRNQAPTPASMPTAMHGAPPIGCVTFNYNGAKLSIICFRNATVYHLATVRKKDIDQASSLPHGEYQVGSLAFRLWEEGDLIHILSLHGNTEDLPEPNPTNENTV